MQQKQLTQEEFDDIRQAVAVRLKNQTKVEESEVPDGFPFPKTYVCAALAKNSFVLGADNLIYRCGLQVGEKHRAVGSLYESNRQYEDEGWWQNFDPCTISSCSKCSFLPVCWGGCPKRHLEKNGHSLDEQSEYWKNNLYSKVVHYVGCTPNQLSVLTQQDQFREGY